MIEKFSGQAGNFSYPINTSPKVWVSVEVKMKNKIDYFQAKIN